MSMALSLEHEAPIAHSPFHGMVGSHPLMLELFRQIQGAARLDAPLVVQGETGTGKELVARALGVLSATRGKLVAVNLSEISENLIESALFGSARGAFTGAVDQRGLLEEATSGTLYLDEAGELSRSVQSKLLRVLETGLVRRLGSLDERPARFRLLLSIQRTPAELVSSGRWRPDFRYRVEGLTLKTPALRDRASDLPLLITHFLRHLGHDPVPSEHLGPLLSYSWPGNVRELIRVVERAAWFSHGRVELDHLVAQLAPAVEPPMEPGSKNGAPAGPSGRTLRDVERRYIEQVLNEEGGSVQATARTLGLTLSALYRRLRSLGLAPPRSR